jgi:hypothetical protein
MAIGNIKTVSGQSTILDSCTGIHYTVNQDKRCNECLINKAKKDSIILRQINDSYLLDSIYNTCNEQKSVLLVDIENKNTNIHRLKISLRISTTISKIGIPGALVTGFLIGMLIN